MTSEEMFELHKLRAEWFQLILCALWPFVVPLLMIFIAVNNLMYDIRMRKRR